MIFDYETFWLEKYQKLYIDANLTDYRSLRMFVHLLYAHVHEHVSMQVSMHVHILEHVHMHVHMHVHVSMHVHVCIYLYVHKLHRY